MNWVCCNGLQNFEEETLSHKYIASAFFAATTLPMGIPGEIVAQTTAERVMSIVATLFMGSLFAYVIGKAACPLLHCGILLNSLPLCLPLSPPSISHTQVRFVAWSPIWTLPPTISRRAWTT